MTELDPLQLQRGARRVAELLQQAGHEAVWAGGCVRDMLMGRTPKDYDIATNATPDQVLRIFPRGLAVGKAFGVIRAPWHGHYYEVATFRKDFTYRDGRRPEQVAFTDAATDAQRRDFTVNAMFYDPLHDKLSDYVQGQADLRARLIRAVGDPAARFEEDHLRMLRAVRFAATLEFTIDPATAAAIRQSAHRISRISAERIQTELTRTLLEAPRPGDALVLLAELRLLPAILPEVAAMQGQAQPPQFHPEGDVFTHTVLMLNALRDPTRQLAWAVLLHDVGKPPTCRVVDGRHRFNGHAAVGAQLAEEIMRRLRMSNDDIQSISYAIGNHMRFMDVPRMRRATLIRLVSAPTFPMELELHRLDCQASHGDLSNHDLLQDFVRERAAQPDLPAPLITGHDIMALGITDGPEIGRWKQAAFEAQLNNYFSDHAAGMQWLRTHMAEKPAQPSDTQQQEQ
ncbi:MAG: CCA tRNA nucleotidyltransferase [Kiritimatiellia bacterium]